MISICITDACAKVRKEPDGRSERTKEPRHISYSFRSTIPEQFLKNRPMINFNIWSNTRELSISLIQLHIEETEISTLFQENKTDFLFGRSLPSFIYQANRRAGWRAETSAFGTRTTLWTLSFLGEKDASSVYNRKWTMASEWDGGTVYLRDLNMTASSHDFVRTYTHTLFRIDVIFIHIYVYVYIGLSPPPLKFPKETRCLQVHFKDGGFFRRF